MRRTFRKRCIAIIVGLVFAILFYKCVISGHSMPIFKSNAISEYRGVTLGGVTQSILIRGENRSNPILLYIHGGPGDPEIPFIIPYQREWEKSFTVVNWDQRGSGRSYNKKIDRTTLTTEQICSDAIELTKYLREQFQTEKIYVMGHSYGTYVGMKCVQEKPEYYHAYVGIGQIGNQQQNEKNLIAYAMEKAKEEKNTEAIEELSTLGNLPYTKQEFGKKISSSRKWTTHYGGAMYGKKDVLLLYEIAVIRPEYSLFNLFDFVHGQKLYYTNTEADAARWELFNANLLEEIPKVEVPVYFIQGKQDYITSFVCCKEYYERLEAPYKKLIELEECAHNAVVEKPREVSRVLVDEVRRCK